MEWKQVDKWDNNILELLLSTNRSMDKLEEVNISVVGHPTSGKTTFINRVVNSTNVESKDMNFEIKIKRGREWLGQKLDLKLFDTQSSITQESLIKYVVCDKDIVIIVFDVSNMESFEAVTQWISFAKKYGGSTSRIILLANKTDLTPCVTIHTMQDLAETNKMKLYFTNSQN